MLEKLDETNFLLYCAKYYDNPQCFDTQEFYDDMNRIKYIKRLFNRFEETGELRVKFLIVARRICFSNRLDCVTPATKIPMIKITIDNSISEKALVIFFLIKINKI